MFSFKHGSLGGDFDYCDADDDSRHETLESRAIFRIIAPKKKGKKGLKKVFTSISSLSGSTSEAENNNNPNPSDTEFPSAPRQFTTDTVTPTRHPTEKDDDVLRDAFSYFDTDPTPTQARLDLDCGEAFPALGATTTRARGSNQSINSYDTRSSAIDKRMAHLTSSFETDETTSVSLDDAFDSLDWDPNLPSVSLSESPEPVSLKPKPVSYTTVGSLVNPHVRLPLSAPRRIQREGVASRAPLISILQGPNFDPYYETPRAPAPLSSLNRANSMAYAQQIGKSPNSVHSSNSQQATFPSLTRSTTSTSAPSMENFQLTEMEIDALRKVQGQQDATTRAGDLIKSEPVSTPSSATRLSARAAPFNSRETSRKNTMELLLQDLQKLPEVPKHADSALRRYRLFRSTSSSPRFKGSPSKEMADIRAPNNGSGELKPGWHFPPPTTKTSSASQANPLFGAYANPTPQAMPAPTVRRGYPQPLTAGPPGPRQSFSSNRASTQPGPQPSTQPLGNIWASSQANSTHDGWNTQAKSQQKSPWSNNWYHPTVQNIYYQIGFYNSLPPPVLVKQVAPPNIPTAPARFVDTLPPQSVAQYYPQGIPANMLGTYTPMTGKKLRQMESLGCTPAEIDKKEKDAVDEFFYSGQRRYATMTSDDHITELEALQHSVNTLGAIGPPKKGGGPGPVVQQPWTVEEMDHLPLSKTMLPMINAAFGSILSYATAGGSSRKALSGWVTAHPDQIDDTPEGNKSLFGEDWGAPPTFRQSARGSVY